ncbi:hypothetical protein MKX01_028775 [Papaver californicum]|nr:hypothetical protein MKX01_028775 [Papaver californicum]
MVSASLVVCLIIFAQHLTKSIQFPVPNLSLSVSLPTLTVSVDERVSNRISEACSKDDIAVFQGPTTPLPNGIPTYTVQILNLCLSEGCSISNIHVSCGWFSSARLINPRLFRRQNYDDCLVNNGEAIGPGDSLSFQYANSFQYPLYVSSVTC